MAHKFLYPSIAADTFILGGRYHILVCAVTTAALKLDFMVSISNADLYINTNRNYSIAVIVSI